MPETLADQSLVSHAQMTLRASHPFPPALHAVHDIGIPV